MSKPNRLLLPLCILAAALVACASPAQGNPPPSPTATLAPTATLTPTPSATPTPSHTPSVTPTRPPTVTPPPSELDDHPAKPLPVALEPGGFLSWEGSVEVLVDNQDWRPFYLSPGADADADVTFEVELQCGGGDTARVALFEAGVTAGVDGDGDGRLSYEEALETGAHVADFRAGCFQQVSATVPGGADYYLLVYPAFGGQTGYALYLSR